MNNASYPISAVLLPKLLSTPNSTGKVDPNRAAGPTIAVVIDTLRFTSTAAVALAHGARGVTVVSEIEVARQVASGLPEGTLLCGERHCVRIAGFHLGNSPSEYVRSVVNERELVFSTTNGTVAVEAVRNAACILLASLLNRAAVAAEIAARMRDAELANPQGRKVLIVCAGTDGQIAMEDVLTAGALLAELLRHDTRARISGDSAQLALDVWHAIEAGGAETLRTRLQQATGGRNLVEAGFAADLDAVARVDSLEVVPVAEFTANGQCVRFECSC